MTPLGKKIMGLTIAASVGVIAVVALDWYLTLVISIILKMIGVM